MSEQEGRMEPDLIEVTDEDNKTVEMEIVDYFFYNGEEYAIVTEYLENADDETPRDCFVMKVTPFTDDNGEEMETFEPVEDDALEEKLLEIANTRLNGNEEDDEEA